MPNIYKYIINIVIVWCVFCSNIMLAQSPSVTNKQDTLVGKIDRAKAIVDTTKILLDSTKTIVDTTKAIVNTTKTSLDSTKTIVDTEKLAKDSVKIVKAKWYKAWAPIGIYVGTDAAKLITNFTNKNSVKIESIVDIYCKNTNWIGVNVGYTAASFTSAALQYSSRSSGVLVTMQKSLFPFVYGGDRDNAFIGIGYGVAVNRIGEAAYQINTIWGNSDGTVAANVNTAHFVELNAGFRMAITKKIMIGWRMQGKTILNNKVFTNIAPITIANYGSGDKGSIFGYNFAITYRVF
jgi:Domain of unknown function (DUF6048)